MLALLLLMPLLALVGFNGDLTDSDQSTEDDAQEAEDEANARVSFPITAENDLVTQAVGARMWGTADNNDMTGSTASDVIGGRDGDDSIIAHSGDDLVFGGDGSDVIRGDDGDDRLLGGDGDDQIFGGNGEDMIYGGLGTDSLFGDAGDDVIAGDADDFMQGGEGNDVLRFNQGGVGGIAEGGAGNDILFSAGGGVTFTGGEGADIFWSSSTDDAGAPTDTQGDLNDVIITDFDPDEDILVLQYTNTANDDAADLDLITSDMFRFAITNVTTELGPATRIDLSIDDGSAGLTTTSAAGSITLVGTAPSEVDVDAIHVMLRDHNSALNAQTSALTIHQANA